MKHFTQNAFGSYIMIVNRKAQAEMVEAAIEYYETHGREESRKKWLAITNKEECKEDKLQ